MSKRSSVRLSKMFMAMIFSLCFALMGMQKSIYAAAAEADHWLQISTGYDHSIGVKADGTVWTWGNNDSGQLGTGSFGGYETLPVQVTALSDIVAVSAGAKVSVAAKKDGTVWTWGDNRDAQLGDGTFTKVDQQTQQVLVNNNKSTPIEVKGVKSVTALSAGYSKTFGLSSNGTVWRWGGGYYKDTSFTDQVAYPVEKVDGIDSISNIMYGWSSAFALKTDGSLWALWIMMNEEYGEIGNGSKEPFPMLPAQISKLKDVISISSGTNYDMVAEKDGSLWAWGNLRNAKLEPRPVFTPSKVGSISNVKMVAAGADRQYALKNDGTVWTWSGFEVSASGEVSMKAEQIEGLSDIVSIYAGGGWTRMFAIDKNGRAYGYGNNMNGALGIGTTNDSDKAVQIGVDLTKPQPPVTPEPETPAAGEPANTGVEPVIHAVVDGKPLTFEDQPPVKMNDRVLVPMRAIFTALGAEVTWNEETQTATGTKGNIVVSITVGNNTATINGKAFELDQPAIKLNDRTLVPVRFVSEGLNALVGWNEEMSTVSITTK